jgi:hypothetical protein
LSHVFSHTWALTVSRMRLAMRNRAFLFFSLIMPLRSFSFMPEFSGVAGPQAVPYLLAEVLALTVMGSFWGLSVQLVTFREQGILRRFRVTPVGASAMLASSLVSNYFLTLPTIAIEFFLSRAVFHMAGLGNVTLDFRLGDDWDRHVRIARPDRGQRHQYDAGNAGHQSDHLVCFSLHFGSDDSFPHAPEVGSGVRSSSFRPRTW